MKTCSGCKLSFPKSEFRKRKTSKDGLHYYCKECERNSWQKHYKNNREKCISVSKKWTENNRAKHNSYSKKWRDENKDRTKSNENRRKKEDPKFREKHSKYNATWRKRNIKEVKAKIRGWQISHPELCRLHGHNRRARIVGNGGTLSKDIIQKLWKLQKGKCAACKTKLKETEFQLDHVVPLARGGKNEDGNTQLLCSLCNRRKHAKDPIKFMQEMGYLL